MKLHIRIIGLLTTLFIFCIIAATAHAKDTRYVVVFQNQNIPENAAQLIEAAGGRLVKTLPSIGVVIAVSNNPGFASSLSNTPGIDSVSMERSLRVQNANKSEPAERSRKGRKTNESQPVECSENSRNDSCFGEQWNIRRVQADDAWRITTGSHRTVVAVIDTGIATNHPDLKDNVLYEFCCPSSEDGCSTRRSGICDPYPEDSSNWGWHGTQVAGIIAASFGGGGLIGVGPNLGLASYNVSEFTGIYDSDDLPIYIIPDSSVLSAMLDAAERGFKVINISLYDLYTWPEDRAIINAYARTVSQVNKKGSLIIACAGNDGINLEGPVFSIPGDLSGVLSVGATGIRPLPFYPQSGAYDVRAYYSNYGRSIDLVAPGGDLGPDCNLDTPENCDENSPYLIPMAGADLDPTCARTESCKIWYSLDLGTSLSSAHVSAVAGLILDMYPSLSPSEVTARLKSTADYVGDPQQFGSGMVNAYRALTGR
jgi:subtilisin family serine protease